MKKMGKILPVEAVVGAAMLKNKGWLRGRICFENEVVYTERVSNASVFTGNCIQTFVLFRQKILTELLDNH